MKEVTYYECEICGNRSPDVEIVRMCESNGIPDQKFFIGDHVEVLPNVMKGIITKALLTPVVFGDQGLPVDHSWIYSIKSEGTELTVYESIIKHQ